MQDRQAQSLRNPSRSAAKIAVGVLIVIAIAGFVLAGSKGRSPAPGQASAADTTQDGLATMTATTAGAGSSAAEHRGGRNGVVFAAASGRMVPAAEADRVELVLR
jgi:hypothetical protein